MALNISVAPCQFPAPSKCSFVDMRRYLLAARAAVVSARHSAASVVLAVASAPHADHPRRAGPRRFSSILGNVGK